jgi:hypothetical protein
MFLINVLLEYWTVVIFIFHTNLNQTNFFSFKLIKYCNLKSLYYTTYPRQKEYICL